MMRILILVVALFLSVPAAITSLSLEQASADELSNKDHTVKPQPGNDPVQADQGSPTDEDTVVGDTADDGETADGDSSEGE